MAPLDADDDDVVDDIVVVAVAAGSWTIGNPSTVQILAVVAVVEERDGRPVRGGSVGSYPRRCGFENHFDGWGRCSCFQSGRRCCSLCPS